MLVHQLLEASATRTPEAVAVIERDRRVTYRRLDEMANRCARLLRHCGVTPGERVVVALDNSTEMVAAYLGTMKAGGAAVPLPGGPRSDRLPTALAECAPRVAIVDEPTARALGPRGGFAAIPHLFVLAPSPPPDSHASFVAAMAVHGPEPLEQRRSDADLAAIIYTSGSTGSRAG